MYCASCGNEIDDGVQYCSDCGHEIGTDPTRGEPASGPDSRAVDRDVSEKSSSIEAGANYDIVMSIEDAWRRRTMFRAVMDVIALLVTAGFWAGWLAVEFISHHYNLKKGKTKPYEEGDEKTFNIM